MIRPTVQRDSRGRFTSAGRSGAEFVRKAKRAQARAVHQVAWGFFSTARYPAGEAVTNVAASHEYGIGVPERPFFRQSLAGAERALRAIVRDGLDGRTMAVTERTANRVGAHFAGELQESITRLRTPPNSPATIRRKGSSNPLLDTGLMRASVTWAIDR